MHFFQLHLPEENQKHDAIKHLPALIHESPNNVNEENKFYDDAIRLKALSEMSINVYTEDCVAAGCPEGLW
jgi:hypothetical protein